MADETTTTETTQQVEQKTETPDPKALANEALKKAGIKLKAKDREYVPRDVDDLVNKANRVFGLESELEAFKKEKEEVGKARESWKKLEAEDDGALDEFDRLPISVQRNAFRALQRKAQAQEQAAKEPPEAARYRQAMEEQQAKLREYEAKEKQREEETAKQQQQRELQEAHASVLKTANELSKLMKLDLAKTPAAARALQPIVARHMRAALLAEQETGVAVDPQEIVANAHRDVVDSFAVASEAMPDDALYDSMGDVLVKRLLSEHLRRVKGIKPIQKSAETAQQANGKQLPKRGEPGFLR